MRINCKNTVWSRERKRSGQKSAPITRKRKRASLTSVKQNYEAQLKAANEQVEFYKNFKAQQSTKAIGESLEQYAESEFNKVRSFAFPNAYFEKDNSLCVGLKATLSSVSVMKMEWRLSPLCSRWRMKLTGQRRSIRMRISTRSWTRIVEKRTVNMRFSDHAWSR